MDDIINFYTRNSDDERLFRGSGMLEFARTKELVLRHVPQGARMVLDVGGGTGIYSDWLGELGYEAHLIDITPSHITSAKARRTHIASAEIGDARKLPWDDASFDVVLLLGPLYHLIERADRLLALREARRVLRSGGVVFAAAICRFAPLLGSLVQGFFDDPAFSPVLERDLRDGQHRNTTGDPKRFTTAYFHRPEEFADEISRRRAEPGRTHAGRRGVVAGDGVGRWIYPLLVEPGAEGTAARAVPRRRARSLGAHGQPASFGGRPPVNGYYCEYQRTPTNAEPIVPWLKNSACVLVLKWKAFAPTRSSTCPYLKFTEPSASHTEL